MWGDFVEFRADGFLNDFGFGVLCGEILQELALLYKVSGVLRVVEEFGCFLFAQLGDLVGGGGAC